MSILAPKLRMASRALDGVPEANVTLALSTRSLTSSYKGPCVQVRRDPPENSLVFLSKVDGSQNDRLDYVAVSATGETCVIGRQRGSTFYDAQGTSTLVSADYGSITPCIAKYASNGSPVWVAGIDGSFPGAADSSVTHMLTVGLDSNVFSHTTILKSSATLPVYSSSGTSVSLPWSTSGLYGAPLVKYSSNGDVLWGASARSPGYNVYSRSIATDQASGIYIGGSCYVNNSATASTVTLYDSAGVAGGTLNATGTYGVGWLGRYNATGNVLWSASIVGAGADDFRAILGLASDGYGGVFATGEFSGSANVMHSNGAGFATLTGSVRCSFIAKYDAAGTAQAAFKATNSDANKQRIATDGVGNVYLAGMCAPTSIFHSNNTVAGQFVAPTGYAAFLVKYNSNLEAVWWTSVDGAQTDTATSVTADANGVYLSGSYATTAGGTANIYHANAAVAGVLPTTTNGGGFFVKYSPSGTVQSWNSTSSGLIEGVALDSTRNRAMVVGYSASGTTANILNQSGTILSSITGTGEAGFLSAFQLGSTLKDIGFKGRSLDISALKTHCPPGSNGYVQTWYSQSPQTQENPNMATATLVSGTNHRYELLGHFTNAIDKLGAGVESYKAFNKQFINFYDIWHSGSGLVTNPKWISFQYPVDVWLVSYTITARNDAPTYIFSPFTWEFQGSNDGSIWTTVNSQSEIQFTAGQSRTFPVSSVATYQYYRLYVTSAAQLGTSGGGDYVAIGDMKIVITNDARQNIDQPLLVENGIVKTNSTNRPLIDFSGGKSLVVPYDATAAGTPIYTANTSGVSQSTYTSTITSGEVIGTRIATPTLIENQQFIYGSTPNTLSSARATIGSTPVLDTLSQHAQTSCLAAFSFRKLFLEYKGPVVRLRRESDNVERDFYGSPSAIEAWIKLPPPLDTISAKATCVAAYSLRQATSDYSGPIVRLRRPSDSLEQDFTAAEFDSGAVATWAGVETPTVVTLHDQSGGGNHLTQATVANQPTIHIADRAIRFDQTSTSKNLGRTWNVFGSSTVAQMHMVSATRENVRGTNSFLHFHQTGGTTFKVHAPWVDGTYYWDVGSADPAFGRAQSNYNPAIATTTAVGATTVISACKNSNALSALRINGGTTYSSTGGTSTMTATGILLGGLQLGASHDFFEWFIFSAKLPVPDEIALEIALGIDMQKTSALGTSSARVVTLYDQSGNGKHATQSTQVNQPLVAKQFGVYVAHFNGTSGVPQFMTFADIYPTSFWAHFYLTALNNSYGTVFAQAGANFGFRPQAMTANSNDFLGTNIDVSPYWIRQGTYGNNFVPNTRNLSVGVWNRVTGSRMTSAGPINQLGRGLTTDFRDLNGFLGELVFFSKPALVSDMLLLDASPLVKTTSTYLSQTLNTTIGRLGALVGRGFSTLLNAVQIMSSFASTSNGPRTGSGSLILNNQNFGNFQYVKKGTTSIQTGYIPTDYFSSVKDTAAAIVVIDGNLTIGADCIFTPPVRKLFTVMYITGNLVLDGEISMTARGANHNGTGESGFLSVFPAQDILVYTGEFGDLFGATNAFVPASGGSGGVGSDTSVGGTTGDFGNYGYGGNSGGGGSGGNASGTTFKGNGAAGTSFSGGSGGGGAAQSGTATTVPLPGEPNGGLGGAGVYLEAYNSEYDGAGNGPNGTGGTLFVICKGTVSGSGRITSHGSLANINTNSAGGGGSGGGSAWLLAGSGGDSIKVTATGGGRARERSGLGGNGSAMKISLRNPSISTSTRSSVVGAYSLRRLFGGWGGPVVRVRHGTTNEQRDFYSEDLLAGAALDVFLGGAVAYIQIWYDQSGSNNHASQTTTTSQPWIVRDASWTTKPTVRCGGTGFLTYNGTGLVNTNYTIAVSTARTSNASTNYFMGGTTSSTNQNLHLGYRTDTQVTHDQYSNNYNMTVTGYVAPISETFVVRHSSTLGKNMYRNGTFLGSSGSLAPLTAYVGSALGRFTWTSIGTVYYAGDISEVILCASYMPDTERSILETSMILQHLATQKLTASDGLANDFFGISVAISSDGTRAVVGAPFYDNPSGGGSTNSIVGADAGAAYIYVRSGTSWLEESKLTASDAWTRDYFGYSVAISDDGTRVLIGAYQCDIRVPFTDNVGAAYVFVRAGTVWSEETRLTASDALANDSFGNSVSISSDGTRALIGSYLSDPSGKSSAGAAYMYVRSGSIWSEEIKLTASDGLAGDQFGISVAVSSDGTRALIGSNGSDPNGKLSAGAAYMYVRSGTSWSEEIKLTASDGLAGDQFGISVAISSDGTRALIGSQFSDPNGKLSAGAAYTYVRSGSIWSEESKLTASDGLASDQFGISVAISSDGTRALIGSNGSDPNGKLSAGAAYMYVRSGTSWSEESKLTASDGLAGDSFGRSVSISSDGGRTLIGSQFSDPNGKSNAGAAYMYVRSGSIWSP